jgi:CII-binding regulator of phage lambda lysogenization HflD
MKFQMPDTRSLLAIAVASAVIVLVFVMALTGKTETDTFKIMVGGLMTVGFASIIGYYFGSSEGSKLKDDTINAAIKQQAPPAGGAQ